MIETTANSALDALEACPCCLLGPQQRSLNTPYTHQGSTEIYADMLRECFNIQLDVAGDVCGVCEECVARLRDASHFKRQVQRSQARLRARLARALRNIETEPPAVVKSEIADEDGERALLLDKELRETADCKEPDVKSEPADDDGASDSLGEEPDVKSEPADDDGASDSLGEKPDVKSEPADDDGASDSLGEKPDVKSEPADDDGASDSLGEEPDVKSEPADDDGASDSLVSVERRPGAPQTAGAAARGERPISLPRCDGGSAHALSARSLSARAREQLAMTCSVRLERLRDEDHEHTRDTSGTQLTSKPSSLTLQEHTGTAYCCHICSKTFPRKSVFTKHVRTHSVKKACARDLNNKHFREKEKKSSLVKHNQIDSRQNNICDICNKQFTYKSNLTTHVRIHTGQKPYTCDICNKQFTRKSYLQEHIRVHTGLKPYTCDIYNKQLSQKSYLQEHVRIHTGQKPYTCDVCNKQFSRKGHLQRHFIIHTGLKPYTCDICNNQFTEKSKLIRHVRIHTGQKPYTCDICNKRFGYRHVLQIHVRIHTGLKPYTCDICNKQFSQKSHLQRHVRIHTGLKPYTCDICNKQFTQKGNLIYHVRIHSRHTLA